MRSWVGVLVLLVVGAPGLSAQDDGTADEFQARVWLDRGDDPLLQRGDRVRIYYRTSSDAYVAIFHIDTDGTVRLLSPRTPDDDHFVRGGRDYRLLFPQSPYWFVDEYPGKGYFFVVASPQPFDFSAFAYTPYERGWDLSQVGRTVYQDPYVAIDEYVARLVPDWQTAPYALDFLSYDVGEAHAYPRFLCYDCHGYRAYSAWNPYTYACSSFRVVIWDDPYFYPAYRYRGTKVVFAQPPRGLARFEFKERAAGETWTPLTRTRQPPTRRSVEYAEPAVAAPEMPEFVPSRRRVVPSDQLRNEATGGRSAQPRGGRTVTPEPGSVADPTRRPGVDPGSAARPGERPTTSLPGRTTVAPPSRGATPARPADPAGGDARIRDPRPSDTRSSDPGSSDPRTSVPRTVTPPASQPRTPRPGAVTTPPRAGERPVLQRRPSGGPPAAKPRPSGTGGRGSRPVRPSVSRPSTTTPSRPRATRPSPTGARPPVAKPRKPGGKPGGSARPASPRKPGGGGHPTPPRRPGGGGNAPAPTV